MPLNDTALTLQANTLQTVLLFAQLHSGLAGMTNMDNIAVPGRKAAHWGTPADTFGLTAGMNFTGGTPGGPVNSVTFWDLETGGVCYGEYVLTGDNSFNAVGEFSVTAIDFKGTASGA